MAQNEGRKQNERCPTCGRKIRRSPDQNARYWLLLHRIAESIRPYGRHHAAPVWHLYFKSKYLGCDDVQMPDGKVVSIPRSSAQLDVAEFSDYMTQVEAWANEHNVWLEEIFE